MGETKHTPGEWSIADGSDETPMRVANDMGIGGGRSIIIAPDDGGNDGKPLVIAVTADGLSEGQERANSHLLTAAPDLLAACAATVAAWDVDEIGQVDESEIDKLRSAIAKATGATP